MRYGIKNVTNDGWECYTADSYEEAIEKYPTQSAYMLIGEMPGPGVHPTVIVYSLRLYKVKPASLHIERVKTP